MKQILKLVATELGVTCVESNKLLHGHVNGINVGVAAEAGKMLANRCVIATLASSDGSALSQQDKAELQCQHKCIARIDTIGKRIYIHTTDIARGKAQLAKKQTELESAFVLAVTAFLAEHGYANVCDKCDCTEDISACILGTELEHLCDRHYHEAEEVVSVQIAETNAVEGNMLLGIVGAIAGALIGVIVIALIGSMGFIASIGGIVLALCALKGYKLLGKKISKAGLYITIAIMVVMVYVAHVVGYAMYFAVWYETTFVSALGGMHQYIFADSEFVYAYFSELGWLYIFTAIGAAYPVAKARNDMIPLRCRQLVTVDGASSDRLFDELA